MKEIIALVILTLLQSPKTKAFPSSKSQTQSINFPITAENSNFLKWYSDLVASTPFFVPCPEEELNFSIPAFKDAKVSLMRMEIKSYEKYVISVDGASKNDFGTFCAKLYESQFLSGVIGIDRSHLRQLVRDHFKSVKPHTGYDAELSRPSEEIVESLFGPHEKKHSILHVLKMKGYVTLDTNFKTDEKANSKLSTFLCKKTKQSSSIRSDTVSFLNKEDARMCGLDTQFDVLLGIASYLNENMDFEATAYEPLLPGTNRKPLSTPRTIQAAEYGKGEFYVAHSDNLLSEIGIRSNYRFYTCILYCNDDWNLEKDGGGLRIYPKTSHLTDPSHALKENMTFEEISPTNGKLLIFDSRLIHSVEEVKSSNKKRRALTVWLMRPEDNGVSANVWNEETGEIDWYKLS